MGEERKVAAILVADIVGYSRLTSADEEATLARLRALRSELFNPAVAAHGGRVVKRTGDGAIVEFRSVVEAVRCALEVQSGMVEHNAGLPGDKRIEFRTGIHLGDVIEEADGDLIGDGVNIAARLEAISAPGGVCLSEDAWRQVRDKIPEPFADLGERQLKNIARPMRVFALGGESGADPPRPHAEPASVVPRRRDSGPVGAIIGAAVGVVDVVAHAINAIGDRAGTAGRPAIGSPGAAPSLEQKARDRRLRRAIIAAAIISLLAARECRERRFTAPPPAQPPPRAGSLDDRLAPAPRLSLISALPRASPIPRSMTISKLSASHVPSGFPPTACCRNGSVICSSAPLAVRRINLAS